MHFRSAIIAVLRYAVVLGGQSRDQSRRIAREMDSMEDAEFPHQEYVTESARAQCYFLRVNRCRKNVNLGY